MGKLTSDATFCNHAIEDCQAHHGQDVRHGGDVVAGKKDWSRWGSSDRVPKNARARQAEEEVKSRKGTVCPALIPAVLSG